MQRVTDPILNLCAQGGDTAAQLQKADLCATAREVKNGTPPAPVTPGQIQAMIDRAISDLNRRHDMPPTIPIPLVPPVLLPVPIEVAPRAPTGSITESHRVHPSPSVAPPRATTQQPYPNYPPAQAPSYPGYGAQPSYPQPQPAYQQPAQQPVQQSSSGLLGNLLNPGRSLLGVN